MTDPGWRPVVRLLPKMFVPVIGMRAMATQPSALISLRMLALYFAVAIVPVWAVVVIVVPQLEPGPSTGAALAIALAAGVATLGLAAFLDTRIGFSSASDFAQTYPRVVMLQLGLAGLAGLVGFVLTILSASMWPYAVGFGFTVAGWLRSAPTAGRLARVQEASDGAGSPTDVVRVLVENQLFR